MPKTVPCCYSCETITRSRSGLRCRFGMAPHLIRLRRPGPRFSWDGNDGARRPERSRVWPPFNTRSTPHEERPLEALVGPGPMLPCRPVAGCFLFDHRPFRNLPHGIPQSCCGTESSHPPEDRYDLQRSSPAGLWWQPSGIFGPDDGTATDVFQHESSRLRDPQHQGHWLRIPANGALGISAYS